MTRERFKPLCLLVVNRSHPLSVPGGKAGSRERLLGGEALIGNRPTGTGAGQVAGDEYRLTLGDRAIGHVEPLHQLRAVGHGRDQFTLCQQGIHPASEPVLADSVEGVGQFVAALVKTVAAFSLQIRLYCSQSFSSGIIESHLQAVVPSQP